MDGSDLTGAVVCENTHRPTPLLGRPEVGSLPAPAERPVQPRPVGVINRKTQPCNSLRRSTSAHVRRAKVRIDPLRQLRSPVRAQAVRKSSGVRLRPVDRLSDVRAEAHRVTSAGVERAKHVRVPGVDESPGTAATVTATPHVSAALPAADPVLTEIQSRQPRSGEGMPSGTVRAAQSGSPYHHTKQMDAMFGKSLRNGIFPIHLQENEFGKPGTGDTPPVPCRAGCRTTHARRA